jgi:hypothetical protein
MALIPFTLITVVVVVVGFTFCGWPSKHGVDVVLKHWARFDCPN